MQMLSNDRLGRWLFGAMYERIRDFSAGLLPEVDPDVLAHEYMNGWFNGVRTRLGYPTVLLYYHLGEDGGLDQHAVYTVHDSGPMPYVYIQQAQNDDKADKRFLEKVIGIGKDIGLKIGAEWLFALTDKHEKVYTKKHGFTSSRHVLSLSLKEPLDGEEGSGGESA